MAEETFRSKIDNWLLIVIVAAVAGVPIAVASMVPLDPYVLAALMAVVLTDTVVVLWIFAGTRYVLGSDSLRVQSGPFRWNVPYGDITDVSPTRSASASPALSLDRLRIQYGSGRSIMISPVDHQAFLRTLTHYRGMAR